MGKINNIILKGKDGGKCIISHPKIFARRKEDVGIYVEDSNGHHAMVKVSIGETEELPSFINDVISGQFF